MNHYNGKRAFDTLTRPVTPAALREYFKAILDAYVEFMDYQRPAEQNDLRRCMAFIGHLAYNDEGKPIDDPTRHSILIYLFGKDSLKKLTRAEIFALTDYVSHTETPHYWRTEVNAILRAHMAEMGQMVLPL